MNKEQKEAWLKEAEMQMKAIRTLEKYNMAALAVAGLGAAFCYFNFRAADRNLLLIICSVVLAALGALSSMEMPAADKAGASKPKTGSAAAAEQKPNDEEAGKTAQAADAEDEQKA